MSRRTQDAGSGSSRNCFEESESAASRLGKTGQLLATESGGSDPRHLPFHLCRSSSLDVVGQLTSLRLRLSGIHQ